MAHVNQELLQRFQKASLGPRRPEGDGHDVQVRQDEDQSLKLQEIVELLVAAGYFRARIKGLSPFDKVFGGLTWCMEALSVDLDVDLLFQENATIGQQIALSEKIVAVLPRIQCPHRVEPHQIQGLDFIHVFPVVQWLVKASMEAREQKSSSVRAYALQQYQKAFWEPRAPPASHVDAVLELYRPQRRFKRKGPPPPDIQSRVQITLLEYEHWGPSRGPEEAEPALEPESVSVASLLTQEEQKRLWQHYEALHCELQGGAPSCSQFQGELEAEQRLLEEIRLKQLEADGALQQLAQQERLHPSRAGKEVEALVLKSQALKAQEAEFRARCKRAMAQLQQEIASFRQAQSPALRDKLQQTRRHLATRNQAVARLQRQLDDVPNRSELAQYQRRFLELYNQVAAKHNETKQYYSLYNTLEDQRRYMRKELGLLNSVADNYPRALQSGAAKEEFLVQLKGAVEGVALNRHKLERQLAEQRRRRDKLAEALQHLLELQRSYAGAVKELGVQGRTYDALLHKDTV